MKLGAYIVAAGAVLGICVWLYFELQPDVVVVIEPAGQAREVPTPPSVVADPHHVVAADGSGIKTKLPVPDAEKVAVAVTIEADTSDAAPVRLLVDAPGARWFPEFSLVRSPIRIRTVESGQADRVTVVNQRMPILALEIVPHVGIGFDGEVSAFAGATLLRIWVLHLGGGIHVIRSDPIAVRPVAVSLIQVRDHLFMGATVGLDRQVSAIVTYGF